MSSNVVNAFQTLGLSVDTKFDDTKAAYRSLARQYHPDKNADDPTATQRFQKISAAWDTLQKHYQNPEGSQGSRGSSAGNFWQHPNNSYDNSSSTQRNTFNIWDLLSGRRSFDDILDSGGFSGVQHFSVSWAPRSDGKVRVIVNGRVSWVEPEEAKSIMNDYFGYPIFSRSDQDTSSHNQGVSSSTEHAGPQHSHSQNSTAGGHTPSSHNQGASSSTGHAGPQHSHSQNSSAGGHTTFSDNHKTFTGHAGPGYGNSQKFGAERNSSSRNNNGAFSKGRVDSHRWDHKPDHGSSAKALFMKRHLRSYIDAYPGLSIGEIKRHISELWRHSPENPRNIQSSKVGNQK